ncbi:hypothetical protein ACOMHN_030650 [Nucella lapillus]
MSDSVSDVDTAPEINGKNHVSVTSQDDVKTANVAGKSEGDQDTAAVEPSSASPVTSPEQEVTSVGLRDDGFYVNEAQFVKAAQTLLQFGRLVIVGPPRSGKTYFALALLQFFKRRDYLPTFDTDLCQDCQESVGPKGRGPKRIVLKEVGYDELRLMDGVLPNLKGFFSHTQEIWGGREWTCLVVITIMPHLLLDVSHKEHSPDTTVLNYPPIIIRMTQDPLHPHLPFTPTPNTLLPFVTRVLRHLEWGPPFSVLMCLVLQGQARGYCPPEATAEMERLGYGSSVNTFHLDLMYRFLKDVLFHPTRAGIINRGVYDACGLGLAAVGALELVLRMCDAGFMVRYVRLDDHGTPAPRTLLVPRSKTVRRRLAMERLYELIADKGAGMEVSQHPSLMYPEVVHEFAQFCQGGKGFVRRMTVAVDEKHRLPVLYWALWTPTPHLCRLCVDLLPKTVLKDADLTVPVLASLLACIFLPTPDSSVVLSVKEFILNTLCHFHFAHEADIVAITLPFLKSDTADARAKIDHLKTKSQSRLCYLSDPALPIPTMALSLTLTEHSLKLTLCRDHWYLALRLLTDTECGEKDQQGNTTLHIAARTGEDDILRTIIRSGASLTPHNKKGLTPPQVDEKLRKNREAQRRVMEDSRGPDLLVAARDGDVESVKVLVCQGASVSCEDSARNTALHLACRHGHCHIVTLLLQVKARPDAVNAERQTPLHVACGWGHLTAAKMLLDHGADVRAPDCRRWAPLHEACRGGFPDIAALLIEHGADAKGEDRAELTPLYLACEGGHTPTAQRLLQARAHVNRRNGPEGRTALHVACLSGHSALVSLLLHHRADVRLKDASGRRPVDLVREMGHEGPVWEQMLHGSG